MASNSDQHRLGRQGQWVTASVIDDAASVIAKVFDERATRPEHSVSGWPRRRQQPPDRPHRDRGHHTRSRGHRRGRFHPRLGVPLGRGVVLLREGEPAAEAWVRDRAVTILEARRKVAAGIRRRPRLHGSQAQANQGGRLRQVLTTRPTTWTTDGARSGWPIASGVIETTAHTAEASSTARSSVVVTHRSTVGRPEVDRDVRAATGRHWARLCLRRGRAGTLACHRTSPIAAATVLGAGHWTARAGRAGCHAASSRGSLTRRRHSEMILCDDHTQDNRGYGRAQPAPVRERRRRIVRQIPISKSDRRFLQEQRRRCGKEGVDAPEENA